MTMVSQAFSVDAGPVVLDEAGLPLLDRELSVLAFNERVLHQARRADVPLLERLRYITIVSSNLDEFFEIRFPDHLEAVRAASASDLLLSHFQSMTARAHALIAEQYRLLNDEVMPALAAEGIRIINHAERTEAQRRWVADYFETQVRPLLVPVVLDPAHPFPMVANKSLNFILRLDDEPGTGDAPSTFEPTIAIVKVPRALPRVIPLPGRLLPAGQQGFVLLTSVMRAHLADLMTGRTVVSFSQFRITRDADLEVDEDDTINLRQALRSGLSTRHFGQAIRLEVVSTCPPELSAFLLRQFELPEAALYAVNGPVNLVRLNQLIDHALGDALRFPRFEPSQPLDERNGSMFALLARQDLLLHHPFESFDPVVRFLREAVNDADVLAIRQTVYRTGNESVLMDLLIEAVRRGKEVTVVLELMARFDEEANINWAERLEAVGAQVIYGLVGLKTHGKLLLVTRRERQGRQRPVLRQYAHLSTGNYNTRTARLYTDVGMLTADPDLTADVADVFLALASRAPMPAGRQLAVAPMHLQPRMLALLQRVADAAGAGRPARVVVKVNALTDPVLIEALVATARAGASIDLVVRGACMLCPGVDGLTDRIRVRSVVGRFLEHTRLMYFRWGDGVDEEALYLGSADWMTRNMVRRVEVAWPLRNPAARQRVIDECLVPYLLDRQDAWRLDASGRYAAPDGSGPGAQAALMQRYGA